MRSQCRSHAIAAVLVTLAGGGLSCQGEGGDAPALSKAEAEPVAIPKVPVPPANGPKLGAVANVTPVFDRPSDQGTALGYLHAGAQVARAVEPFTREGCEGGWYPIRPKGFVCATSVATTNLNHPTLVAMAIAPKLDAPMPYTYARTVKATTIFRVDPKRERSVAPVVELAKGSHFAVVGSWEANDPEGQLLRLAMMTDGRFVPATDLEAANPSRFEGVAFDDEVKLPVAYVVKRGVRAWAVDGQKTEKRALLDYHQRHDLTGRFRTIDGLRFWETNAGTWVRHKDVTVIRRRDKPPEFVTDDTKWIDISIVTNTLVLYEGTRAVFATLVSTGRDRLGDPETTESTPMGEFRIVAKHVTAANVDSKAFSPGKDSFDVPWVLEMANGKRLLGAYWHDRFGIETGPGDIQLAPADAARIWAWADPPMPAGWHGMTLQAPEQTVIVNIRK